MKTVLLLALLGICTFSSCFVFDFDEGTGNRSYSNSSSTNRVTNYSKHAIFDISNLLLMRKTDDYVGKVLGLSGGLVEQVYTADKETWVEIRGRTGDRGFDLMIYLDHPLPKQTNIGENIITIGTGSQVRMLAKFRGFEEFTDEYGSKRKLPVGECIAIFQHSDFNLLKPIWQWNK